MKAQKSPRPSAADSPDRAAAPRLRIVRDPDAADLLTNPESLRQLEPFLGFSRTVSEAARLIGAKPNTMLARVRRMLRAGLLEVHEIVPRAGRAMKRYRATADVFFVPFDATSAESLEEALAARDAYWEQLLRRNVVRVRREAIGHWGTRIYRDGRGRLQVQTAITPQRNVTTLEPDGPAILSAWRDSLQLDFADAKALQRELFELLLRYQQKRGAQRYIVHLGLAPVLETPTDG